jgi:hypothetical protein
VKAKFIRANIAGRAGGVNKSQPPDGGAYGSFPANENQTTKGIRELGSRHPPPAAWLHDQAHFVLPGSQFPLALASWIVTVSFRFLPPVAAVFVF